MTPASAAPVRVTRLIRADPESVFRAWTEPDQLQRWACPEASSIDDVQVDLRVGGSYRIRMRGEQGPHTACGTYREITPARRLVYSWDWEEADNAMGETLVTVEFIARGDDTEVVLTHERLPGPDARRSHREGWESCLTKLERLLPSPTRA